MDNWVGGVPLGVRFSRIFELAENGRVSVAEMSQLGREEGGEAWRWRRRLFAWEEENVWECISLLSNFIFFILTFLTSGSGYLILLKVILSARCISLHLRKNLLIGVRLIIFGINRFH